MENILTLNKINRSDTSIAGYRAVDLAELYSKKFNVPICFVIKSSLFETFMKKNNLTPRIQEILSTADFESEESLEDSYAKIRELFANGTFMPDDENELIEAYETLAIDMDHLDIAKLVSAIEKPFLTIIGSPNYVQDSESNECIFQNVKGKVRLFNAIKDCWATLYSPKELKYRKDNEIEAKENMAIIVQRMIESDTSAQVYTDEEDIIVKSFFGYQDFYEEFEKDITVFSKGNLTIKNNKANFQEYQYIRDARDNQLVKKALKTEGEKQKLNDKELEELARITKRVEGFLEKPVKTFMTITKGKIYLLSVNRIIRKKKEEVEEEVIQDEPTD
ncbi:PEP/pyruvate-binding domain-containing protein, partial [Bacteroidota bacterium]